MANLRIPAYLEDELEIAAECSGRTKALSVLSPIERALFGIADYPCRGALQSELTRIADVEVRSRLVQQYRIFYVVGGTLPEIVGLIHPARDVVGNMARRLQ